MISDPIAAFRPDILLAPGQDVYRLAAADFLTENEADAPCVKMDCTNGKLNQKGRPKCPDCRGSGRVSNGFADHGEFIRVGCELAHQNDIPWRYSCEVRDALAARHADLLARGKEWLAIPRLNGPNPLNSPTEGNVVYTLDGRYRIPATVSRGFVSEIAAPSAALTDDVLRAVFSWQPVETVTVSDREPYQETGISVPYWWAWFSQLNEILGRRPAEIPTEMYSRLPKCPGMGFGRLAKHYPTRAAALQALSDAHVRHGRELAGLTHQEPTKEFTCV